MRRELFINKEKGAELMPTPEVTIERKMGLELLADLQNLPQHSFSDENEEALSWIALCYDHPEYKGEVLAQIAKHKSFIKDPNKLYEEVISELKKRVKEFSPLDIEEEIRIRKTELSIYKQHIDILIEYFCPQKETTNVGKVVIVPSDQILPSVESGRGIKVAGISFIMSHSKNPDNFDHEFLHNIINPITQEKADYFEVEENKNKIFEYTNGGIEGYGDYPVSILNEELINTYIENVRDGGKKITLDALREELPKLTEEDFEKIKRREVGNKLIQDSFQSYKSIAEILSNLEDYYHRFIKDKQIIKNELRKRILDFYKRYEESKINDKFLTFEQYFLKNYRKILT